MRDEEKIELCRRALERSVRESGAWITGDGRISEQTAGELLGMGPRTLSDKRQEGDSPKYYHLGGGGGHRITYSLYDLAVWIESKRVNY